jgi:hypothetical protein
MAKTAKSPLTLLSSELKQAARDLQDIPGEFEPKRMLIDTFTNSLKTFMTEIRQAAAKNRKPTHKA